MSQATNELPEQAATALLQELQYQTALLERQGSLLGIIAWLVALPLILGLLGGIIYAALFFAR